MGSSERGDLAEVSAPPGGGGISWDIDLTSGNAETTSTPAGIDWGIDLSSTAMVGAGDDAGGTTAAIDWGIDMSDTGTTEAATAVGINWDILSSPSPGPEHAGDEAAAATSKVLGVPSSVPEGQEAVLLRLERDADFRGRLLDDLQELRAFLVQVRRRPPPACI